MMKNEFIDYYLSLGVIITYVILGVLDKFSTEFWIISMAGMMFVIWFIVWNNPIGKFLEIQKVGSVE